MIHYELFFFYIAGFKPKDVIKTFGFSRGTAYRFYRIYRKARIDAQRTIRSSYSISPEREKKAINLGDLLEEI